MMKKINYLLVLVLSAAGLSSCEPSYAPPANEPASIVISQREVSVAAAGGLFTLKVSHNVDYEIRSNVKWITQDMTRAETEELNFSVAPNPSTEVRTGRLTFLSTDEPLEREVTVTQEGKIPDLSLDFDMVFVKGGTFWMGATSEQGSDAYDNEKPAHRVTLSDYYIGKYEVTQGQWKAVMGTTVYQQRNKANPSWPTRGVGDNYPMYYVNYYEAQEFVQRLNERTGKRYALPTEAQWEYAARGGNKCRGYKYSGSNSIGSVAWYCDNSDQTTHPVGTKSPNELGLYDMSGNVWEWCADWYGDYSSGSQTNPQGPSWGSSRMLRGGSWFNDARGCRVSRRGSNDPDYRSSIIGFRLALLP